LEHRTTDFFIALDFKTGTVIAAVYRRHRRVEFCHFLHTVERATPVGFELHLVFENSSTHKNLIIQRRLLRYPHVHFHFTPTSASRINLVECWFLVFTAQPLRLDRFCSTRALKNAIRAYMITNNVNLQSFISTDTTDHILQSGAKFCMQTFNSNH
jgi:hypothetical protein